MKRAEMQDAISRLREWLKPGDTVYTVLRSVSRSGMSRRISVVILRSGEPQEISGLVADALSYSFPDRGEGLRVNGCGMDMGFEVVYNLGRVLWPQGTEFVSGRNGSTAPELDGGYALHQRWL